MGIASFSPSLSPSRFGSPSLSLVLAPVQALVAFFMPVQPSQAKDKPVIHRPVQRLSHAKNINRRAPATAFTATSARPISRLKVMREFEPGMGRSQSGRMVISGRMADVCAELDRISQKDTARIKT